ncbi:MAG: type II secretion system F family protein [Candidatus Nanohaloarchaea archaeon]
MLEKFKQISYDLAGPYALQYIHYFEGLRPQLTKAGLDISLPEYLSMMMVSVVGTLVLSFFGIGGFLALSTGISGFLMGIIFGIIFSILVFAGFYIYPSILISNRASKIRDTLPFATMYLSTLAGTGTSLPEIFENLSEVEEYGEVSKEAAKISRDVNTLGMDISEALKRAAERTPSDDFEELVWGINHSITTGGSLREFLRQRAETLMNDYQRRVEEFADQLSLLVEMYITIVIVGSIIFTSMSAVMSSFASMSPELVVTVQAIAIFIGLPLISGMFIILVRGMAPEGIR